MLCLLGCANNKEGKKRLAEYANQTRFMEMIDVGVAALYGGNGHHIACGHSDQNCSGGGFIRCS